MPNQPENIHYNTAYRRVSIIFIILFVIIAFSFIGYIMWSDRNKNNSEEKSIDRQLKTVTLSLDSLKKGYVVLQENGKKLSGQLSVLQFERQQLIYLVSQQENKLATIKKRYEKISSYTGISIDSLHSVFSARFKDK